jgi:hypothetical protein
MSDLSRRIAVFGVKTIALSLLCVSIRRRIHRDFTMTYPPIRYTRRYRGSHLSDREIAINGLMKRILKLWNNSDDSKLEEARLLESMLTQFELMTDQEWLNKYETAKG